MFDRVQAERFADPVKLIVAANEEMRWKNDRRTVEMTGQRRK